VLGALGTLALGCARSRTIAPATSVDATPSFAPIESRVGGRLGVYALDTGSGREWAHRADERFAMCSTFKWVLAACVLARVDRSELSLDERVPYSSLSVTRSR
jgi:beta-lactamase class A